LGITIHWELEAPPGKPETAAAKLEQVRQSCLKLPLKELGEVEHIRPRTCAAMHRRELRRGRQDELYWAVFCARKYVPTGRGSAPLRPLEVVRLPLLAGEECETTVFVLARYPGEEGWSGEGFTKTQYATHFVESHLLVIAALEACRAAGILKEVVDEGGFWETRDLKELAKNLNATTALIERVLGSLRECGWSVASPIEESRNIMRVADGDGRDAGGGARRRRPGLR
jgi:hypothetical protein